RAPPPPTPPPFPYTTLFRSEIARLDPNGREQLRIARFAMDAIDSGQDRSQSPAFRGAREHGVYCGPVYFVRETEPFLTLALAGRSEEHTSELQSRGHLVCRL